MTTIKEIMDEDGFVDPGLLLDTWEFQELIEALLRDSGAAMAFISTLAIAHMHTTFESREAIDEDLKELLKNIDDAWQFHCEMGGAMRTDDIANLDTKKGRELKQQEGAKP